MTRHLGVSAFFSATIVVFFAIALYQPDGPAAPPSAPPAAPADSETARGPEERLIPTADVQPAPVTPVLPVAQTRPMSNRSAPRHPTRSPSEGSRPNDAAHGSSVLSRFAPGKTRRTRLTSGERQAFIQADAGETVVDVALRVYGSPDAARALWMANRDILPDRDTPLSAPTVLRTP